MELEEAKTLSAHACLSGRAVRRRQDESAASGLRLNFAVDSDRVLHSLAYTRYIDKTQVFSLLDNEHITHRVLHVQLVSKIARTVGRFLRLNQDLLEAIALAHDIGHPPFGHEGERFLSKKCVEHGLGIFQHNLQGVHFLEKVENRGQGLNLSLQVLDGVLCHDGEALLENLAPSYEKDFSMLDEECRQKSHNPELEIIPMTMEGCLVRLVDSVAYAGRDFEDAILVGLVRREDLPAEVARVLGTSNGTMVYRLVEDLITNSLNQPWVGFSPTARQALLQLKAFNLQHIYKNPLINSQQRKIEDAFQRLFDIFGEDVRQNRLDSLIFKDFLNNMNESYLATNSPAIKVRDFMASMTDNYFMQAAQELIMPMRYPKKFTFA